MVDVIKLSKLMPSKNNYIYNIISMKKKNLLVWVCKKITSSEYRAFNSLSENVSIDYFLKYQLLTNSNYNYLGLIHKK
ncbi:hypothetical protein BpHYR1_001653 [Brachionus plicatilis]|uniref:Uncharacterized protein n=1 Tax=Brachionus plicatilis TaxID=10195 RepID=A0A3M7SY43_BRAPC|nr:hypothetical protein BpHYR1_001653 [Brachionus plicatilis]